MRARVESARQSFQARTRLAFALAGIVLAALLVVGLTSAANPSQVGVFELDGDGFTTATSTAADWNCLFGTPTNCPATQPTAKTLVNDKVNDTTDDILGGGSKDILDTDQWNGVTQKPPAKDDLAHAAWANYNVSVPGDANKHDILYFSADRISNNGDAFMGFWFFKGNVAEDASGKFTPKHSVGDTLVLVNFVQGQGSAKISGGSEEIGVFEWVGTGGDVNGGTLQTVVPLTQAQCVGSPATIQACGQFNLTSAPSVWPFQSTDSGDPANTWTPTEFVEGGIDLTSLFPNGIPCFASVMAETRSSDSPTAEQKDIVLGQLSNCGKVKIVKDAQPDSSQSFGYTSDLPGASTFNLTDNGTSANTNEVDDVKPGSYTVTENANPAGWNLTGVSCDDTNSTGSVPNRSASITVDPSETVTCTFTNQKQPTLTVNKVCNPANDAGKFNLQIDGANAKSDATCGTGTGAVASTVGAHTVGEQAGAGTSLSNYSSVIGGDCAADGTITLAPGQNAVCTITNTRNATLTVNKVCVPANDTGKFNLQVDGQNAKVDATCGTGTGAQVYAAGSHTVGEAGGSGTDLSNYTSVVGGDCAANGSITLAAGDNKTCTITNTRKPTLTVNKVCVPANDTGKFNLQIDGQTAKADATCGTGTGAVVTSVGAHTVGELAGTGNDLGLYTSVIGGDCAVNGSITLAAGQNAVCTITNTRKPSITVNKVCVPANDGGKFNLKIDTNVAKTDATCGTGTGPVVSSVGSHTVAEAAGTGTDLSNYTSVIGGDCAANGSVTLAAGQSAVCTITNTRKPTLTVNKVCGPTTDTGKFNLQIDGATAGTGANAACGGTTGAVVSTVGNHSIGETYGTGTSSSDYFPGVFGGDCSTDGKITLSAGQNAVCTITNNRKGAIAITKTPATQAVDSGGTATFTITVTNTGPVTLTNVTVTDPLSLNCAKTIGTLTPGQVSTYTCTQPNVTAAFTNTATVTGHPPFGPDLTASASANVTVNAPPPPPPATPTATPAPTVVDLAIVKTASPTSMTKGANVTYTLTVTNNGPVTDTAVQVADSLPFGVTYVSATSSQGTCSGTSVVQCNVGTMTNGQKVTITIVGTTTTTGTIVNTATVVGALPETTLTNNSSSASITVAAPPAPKPAPKPFKPPVVKPKPKPVPPPCYAVVVAPKTLTVGKSGHLQLRVTAKNKGISGVKVEVKGAGILKLSGRTDSAGKVTLVLHPKKAGIVLVKPASYKGCTNPRIGVIGAFTPPVTG